MLHGSSTCFAIETSQTSIIPFWQENESQDEAEQELSITDVAAIAGFLETLAITRGGIHAELRQVSAAQGQTLLVMAPRHNVVDASLSKLIRV